MLLNFDLNLDLNFDPNFDLNFDLNFDHNLDPNFDLHFHLQAITCCRPFWPCVWLCVPPTTTTNGGRAVRRVGDV